jgi:hypothetical protein
MSDSQKRERRGSVRCATARRLLKEERAQHANAITRVKGKIRSHDARQ